MTHCFFLSHFDSPWRSYFIKKLSIELAANMQLVVCNKCKKSSPKSIGYMAISTTFIQSIAARQSIHLIQTWGIRCFCLSICVRFFVCATSSFCVMYRLFVCCIVFLCAASSQIGTYFPDIDRGMRFRTGFVAMICLM